MNRPSLMIAVLAALLFFSYSCVSEEARVRTTPEALSYDEHIRLGSIYEAKGMPGKAQKEYEAALVLNEDDSRAYFGLGNIFLKTGNFIDAEQSYLKAIELDPTQGFYHNNLAWAYIYIGNLAAARVKALEAAAIDVSRLYLYYDTLGFIETKIGNYGEAERLLKEALVLAPFNDTMARGYIYTHLVELYKETGEVQKEKEARERLRELPPLPPVFL